MIERLVLFALLLVLLIGAASAVIGIVDVQPPLPLAVQLPNVAAPLPPDPNCNGDGELELCIMSRYDDNFDLSVKDAKGNRVGKVEIDVHKDSTQIYGMENMPKGKLYTSYVEIDEAYRANGYGRQSFLLTEDAMLKNAGPNGVVYRYVYDQPGWMNWHRNSLSADRIIELDAKTYVYILRGG